MNIPYVAIRAKRWIPNDFRQRNYIIAEKLLDEAYRLQIQNKLYSDLQWAGLELSNLTMDLQQAIQENIFPSTRNRTPRVLELIQDQIKLTSNPSVGKNYQLTLDKFRKK